MAFFEVTDLSAVSHGIQLAVAPVFLLTAVAGMIGTVAGRLARIIDRARIIEQRLPGQHASERDSSHLELRGLRLRGRLVNVCIALLTLCGVLIGSTILALFLAEMTPLQSVRVASTLFLAGVVSFVLALLIFLTETLIATRVLRFGPS